MTPVGSGLRLDGSAARVPWSRHAQHVVVVAPSDKRVVVGLVAAGRAVVEHDRNLALEPRDTLTWNRASAGAR